jgi:outer membrane protein TolC
VLEALRISQDYQRQLHDAVGAGIAFKGDELRVQVQTERAAIALRQAQEQARTTSARLAKTLHLDPVVELVPRDGDPLPLPLVTSNAPLSALVQQALEARPELRQSEAVISANKSSSQGAKYGPLVPSLGAQAFAGGLGGGKDGETGRFGRSEDLVVFLGWRVGPGGLLDASRTKAADARLAGARLAADKLRDEIIQQVVESRTQAQSLADQLATTQTNLATATEALRLTEQRREFAVGVVLEVIQAQQELTRARYDYISTIAEYNKAEYTLNRALGASVSAAEPGSKH